MNCALMSDVEGKMAIPLIVEPRLDAKLWGGRRLAGFGFALPPGEAIGEAVITAGDSVTATGQTLGEIVAADPARAIGAAGLRATGNRSLFPLLAKLIDANEDLSIQVHPDDAVAATTDELGKTEAWWILEAVPGAKLYVGLKPGTTFADVTDAIAAGRGLVDLMRVVPAQPNSLIFLPAGTVHAIGAGILLYEIQQPSSITYRLDDWGRVDAQGRPRELHIEQGLAVTNVDLRPEPTAPLNDVELAARTQTLVECDYFALDRIALSAGQEAEVESVDSPQVLTVIDGQANISTKDGSVSLRSGQTAVLLADTPAATTSTEVGAVILRATVPK
jgi:mannose-6-phosphate isomerase